MTENVLQQKIEDLITNVEIKDFVYACIKQFPVQFWKIPSSSSGDYHPTDEHTTGGLVLHTLRVVEMCCIFKRMLDLDENDFNELIAAAIIHDSMRCGMKGQEKVDSTGKFRTDPLHPFYPAYEFDNLFMRDKDGKATKFINCQNILQHVACHYGIWSKITVTQTHMGMLLYHADYIVMQSHVIVNLK